jgi:hypothetical protein
VNHPDLQLYLSAMACHVIYIASFVTPPITRSLRGRVLYLALVRLVKYVDVNRRQRWFKVRPITDHVGRRRLAKYGR